MTEEPLPRLSPRAFLLAWAVFWLLMVTASVQDHLRQGRSELWQPLLWEGTSCLVASVVVVLLWRRLHRHDHLLHRPWRWFGAQLLWLPPLALAFVAAVYALRHGVYALAGQVYRHETWDMVLRYETVKFGLFYLMFIAILFGLRSHAAMGAQRARTERLHALTQQAQLLQLTQQIEPHFLFNALNTIASTVHSDPELADTLLLRLSALLRAATDLARRPEVALEEEMRLLQAYTDIMRQRFGDRLALEYDVDPAAAACQVPTLLLQPLVENALRHGLERHPGPGRIQVRARLLDGKLLLQVEDDMGSLAVPATDGVGLSNLRQRLALRYGAQATLQLAPRPGGGVLAAIELPCGS